MEAFTGDVELGQASGSHRLADPAKPPRSLDTASWFAVAGLVLVGLANAAWLAKAVGILGTGEPASYAGYLSLDDSLRSFGTRAGLSSFAYALAACMYLPWFGMAYGNLRRLGVQHLRWSNGWAVGSWFVPILSLFRPKQIANDIWRGSETGAEVVSEGWLVGGVSRIVHWWWALFLLGGFVAGISFSLVSSGRRDIVHAVEIGQDIGPGFAQARAGAVVALFGAGALLAAGVLGAIFVRRATRRLESIRRQVVREGPRPLQVVTAIAPPPLVKCPECAELVSRGRFCSYCGYELTGSAKR